MMTYISLFSSAGVGCYGFKLEGFECIATNELIERRLEIQKFNSKCKYESGYICGDITKESTKDLLRGEIELWKRKEKLKRVDVVIATPPCQGMSVANHKKSSTEIIRNSLVIESIKIIKEISPKFFVFENVPAFMKTICTDIDGVDKPISEAIKSNLGKEYSFVSKVINFKNYGACSSRQRTVVIGVAKDYSDEVSPFELYPQFVKERTLRETIGHLKPLTIFGEISSEDIYHAFREYPKHMREWIHDLKEGESAFDNSEDTQKPHQIIDGRLVVNVNKNGDKYKRQVWDKVGPCVHTRNDQLASQNTVHPADDRVFSIRELMLMMAIPDSFKWSEESTAYLNGLTFQEKKVYLKKNETKIRQSLGEAVPTVIFNSIARNIKETLSKERLGKKKIIDIINDYNLMNTEEIKNFIDSNELNLSLSSLSRIAEMANTRRTEDAAYYTSKTLITEIINSLPDTDKDEIRILEPSVGVGNFIPLILKKFEGKKIIFDLVDIDASSLEIANTLLTKLQVGGNVQFNFIVADFLEYKFVSKYDYVIGNPPFYKMSGDKKLKEYVQNAKNKHTSNICSFFLDKAIDLGRYLAFVFPKFLLNTPEFKESREYLSKRSFLSIIDFGEHGFPGVTIETIAFVVDNESRPRKTKVQSLTNNIEISQEQGYIFDPKFPYWIIYRDLDFDKVYNNLEFGVFEVFRDRQITNGNVGQKGDIRVLKARNITDSGEIIDIEGYDAYMDEDTAKGLTVYAYLNNEQVYLTPNMTYYPRVIKKPTGVLVNGSVAILIPKCDFKLTKEQMDYFATDEYRNFYRIARNYQTRSLNVDTCSVFFFGIKRQ